VLLTTCAILLPVIGSRRCLVGLGGRSWALKTLGNGRKEH
jgi:hypothetical protein